MRREMQWPRLIGTALLAMILATPAIAQADPDVQIHAYPELLTPRDVLTDGDAGRPIRIDDNTLFLWVDLQPGARFTHPTAYVLISPTSVRVLDGGWWAVLNGRRLFIDGTETLLRFPFEIRPRRLAARLSAHAINPEPILVYGHPFALRAGDVLEEGPVPSFTGAINDEALLVWIDLHPTMRFVHDTYHLLVTSDPVGVKLIDGQGWPELNRRRILYGEHNDWGMFFPFDLGQ